MAARYNVHDALSMILDDDFRLSDGEESNFEGEEVCGYRPECHLNLSVLDDREGDAIEEDGEAMEVGSHFRLKERVMDSDSSKSTLSEGSYMLGKTGLVISAAPPAPRHRHLAEARDDEPCQ